MSSAALVYGMHAFLHGTQHAAQDFFSGTAATINEINTTFCR